MPKVYQRPEYSNQQAKEIIMEYIHDKDDRKMLFLHLVDGDTIEEIAGKVGLDRKTVWRRLRKGEKVVFSHFPG